MPGPPTSGCAGCAIARPQGLHTGLYEEPIGIRPPSGLPQIPCETGEAPAARQLSDTDGRAGISRLDRFVVTPAAVLKSRSAA
jgi:hypothetical protein